MELGNILLAVGVVSLCSLVGVAYLWTKPNTLQRLLPGLVAFAAGVMLAVSFFDLLPESFEQLGEAAPIWIVGGILAFLVFERMVHWHHSHDGDCEDDRHKSTGYSVLLGDGLHNFLDGLLIASAFAVNPAVGWSATAAIIAHEIPQELGDYAVLIHSGFSAKTALGYNLLSALFAVVGGLVGFWFAGRFDSVAAVITAVGAGGLLYISLVDLLAEIRNQEGRLRWWSQMLLVVVGVVVAATMVKIFHGE